MSKPLGDLLKELQDEDFNREAKAEPKVEETPQEAIQVRGLLRPRGGKCRMRGTMLAFEKLSVQDKASESESEYYTALSTFDESSQDEG